DRQPGGVRQRGGHRQGGESGRCGARAGRVRGGGRRRDRDRAVGVGAGRRHVGGAGGGAAGAGPVRGGLAGRRGAACAAGAGGVGDGVAERGDARSGRAAGRVDHVSHGDADRGHLRSAGAGSGGGAATGSGHSDVSGGRGGGGDRDDLHGPRRLAGHSAGHGGDRGGDDGAGYSSSTNTCSRRFLIAGRTVMTRATAVSARSAPEIGRVRKTVASPREMMSARRRLSSSSGPRTKPSSSGAGLQPYLIRT